jgi:predicted DNA-binding transcriptional regulator AlpA
MKGEHMKIPEFVSRVQLLGLLGISPATLGRMLEAGTVPQATHVGDRRVRYWTRAQVEAILARGHELRIKPLPTTAEIR